jgi:hypothetical protein
MLMVYPFSFFFSFELKSNQLTIWTLYDFLIILVALHFFTQIKGIVYLSLFQLFDSCLYITLLMEQSSEGSYNS